jgi:transcriptional regulator with XRE-family HTH domain
MNFILIPTSVIGRYERDEMTPSIEAARKIAKILGTTVGYLLDETEQGNLFKDPDMLKRLNEIKKMEKDDKNNILYAIDGLIKSIKLKNIAAF